MVKTFTTRSDQFNRLNLQLYYIEQLAELIEKIGRNLGEAGNSKISEYRSAKGQLYTFKDLMRGARLSFHERDVLIFNLYMDLATKLESYDLIEGTRVMRNAFELLIKIAKQNNLIFPQRTRAFGFKSFVEEEIQ